MQLESLDRLLEMEVMSEDTAEEGESHKTATVMNRFKEKINKFVFKDSTDDSPNVSSVWRAYLKETEVVAMFSGSR